MKSLVASFYFLNFLIFISFSMIVIMFETDIVPPGFARKNIRSNRIPFHYEKSEPENIKKRLDIQQLSYKKHRLVYHSFNDTFLPLIKPEVKKQYGGFQEVDNQLGIYTYSANYDRREKPPIIQVVVIAPILDIPKDFICVLWNQHDKKNSLQVEGNFTFFPEPNWNYTYRSGVVHCPLPNQHLKPREVSLVSRNTLKISNTLPIRYPGHRWNNLTRCYPAFHSAFSDVTAVIWNIEISRLFGVDKFIFYNNDMNETVSKVLRQYQEEGLVEVRNWYLPIDQRKLHYWGQLASMHDCFLSQVRKTRFVLFADIDELVIPRKVSSIVKLAESLLFDNTFTNKNFGALVFRNVFFPVILPEATIRYPEKSSARMLQISPLLHTIHSQIHGAYDRSKLLVIPEAIDCMWVHAVERFRKGWIPRVVDWDVALLHHYRYIPTLDMKPPWESDEVLLSYSSIIVEAVKRRFGKLKSVNALSY